MRQFRERAREDGFFLPFRPELWHQGLEEEPSKDKLFSHGTTAMEMITFEGHPLFPPWLQKCDVHNEEQGHEEARNQYKRETLHETSVVKRAEQDGIQKIGDAEQVP